MAAPPDIVVSGLLENLKDFLMSNVELISGLEDNANALLNELDSLNADLKKCMEQKYSDDNFLARLTQKVQKQVYKAEDAIETYISTVSKQKYRVTVKSVIQAIEHAMELLNISKVLDSLKQEVNNAYQEEIEKGLVVMQGVQEGPVQNKHPITVDDDMVGFRDVMFHLIEYLKSGPEELQTVSIVGMPGLGKTTVAKQIFKHPIIEFHFGVRAFVVVSQVFTRREVLIKLVSAMGYGIVDDMDNMTEDHIMAAIRNYLEEKNFLVVLDNVWTNEVWNFLKFCFPNNQNGSRVLITTRSKNVAEHARIRFGLEPYCLRFLCAHESRELLRKRVFGEMNNFPYSLEVYETAILEKCKGLPLAILLVAGVLQNHPEGSYWWERLAYMVESCDLAKECHLAINLCFNHLPYHLKTCFLYFGVFPQGCEIPSKTLFQLWISERFVPQGDARETCETKAESYLKELVDRGMVIVEKRRLNGRIKTIRISDTLHEFCTIQAIKEKLFREIESYNEQAMNMSVDDDRRLCINFHVMEYIARKNKLAGKYVRSFLSFGMEDFNLPLEYISEIPPKAFTLLRVLDVRSIRFVQFPTELFYMFLLKYIAMSAKFKTIPEKLSNLRYLQTFIFNTTVSIIELKADIWKMKQLRHLETNASTSLLKTKELLSVNANLQTLSTISPESCTAEVLKRAQQLKKLSICGELAPLMNTLSLELGCLENLKLLNYKTVPLKSLPNYTSFPVTLTRMTLQNTMLSWEWMSTLAKLKKLEILKLKANAFTGEYWDTESTGAFGALKVLQIGQTDLVAWKASEVHFPQLTHLYLRHCINLGDIPSNLVNISALEFIDIYYCNHDVVDSARDLVLTKLQVQAQQNEGKTTQLKLNVYPPEEW